MFTKRDIIDIAVKIEKNGESVYRRASEQIENPDLADFLKWAAEEECRHAAFFSGIADEIRYESENPKIERLGRILIEDAIGGHSFSLDAEELAKSECLSQLIAKSIQLEEDTVLFYELLADLIDGESVKRQLDAIINEERGHIARLREFMPAGRAKTG